MTLQQETHRRHLTAHPLAELTDDELEAIIELGKHLSIFNADLALRLNSLVDLAHHEDSDRYARECDGANS